MEFWKGNCVGTLRRPHPARMEVTCGDTDMDWPRLGTVLHTTGLGQILPRYLGRRCCQQNQTESSVKEKTQVYHEGNLTVEEYIYGITRRGIRPYGEIVESCEGVRGRPARSSADVCQRGAVRQRMGGGNTPSGVSPHPQGARLALRLVRQGDGLHYPVGQPLFGDSLPFLLPSVADKELLRASDAPGVVHVYAQCSYGTQQR